MQKKPNKFNIFHFHLINKCCVIRINAVQVTINHEILFCYNEIKEM